MTSADMEASGKIAVAPILARNDGPSSASSSEKDSGETSRALDHANASGHRFRVDPLKHNVTFETFGDPSFYAPIEQYEGKHRYDPKFQWMPKEERQLVRKVHMASKLIELN